MGRNQASEMANHISNCRAKSPFPVPAQIVHEPGEAERRDDSSNLNQEGGPILCFGRNSSLVQQHNITHCCDEAWRDDKRKSVPQLVGEPCRHKKNYPADHINRDCVNLGIRTLPSHLVQNSWQEVAHRVLRNRAAEVCGTAVKVSIEN